MTFFDGDWKILSIMEKASSPLNLTIPIQDGEIEVEIAEKVNDLIR